MIGSKKMSKQIEDGNKLFKEKKYIAYESTLNKRSFIIYANNKKEVLFQDENEENEENEIVYKNTDYSLIINFSKRLDEGPSEDQGEAIYILIVKNLKTGKKVVKEVYCYCTFF